MGLHVAVEGSETGDPNYGTRTVGRRASRRKRKADRQDLRTTELAFDSVSPFGIDGGVYLSGIFDIPAPASRELGRMPNEGQPSLPVNNHRLTLFFVFLPINGNHGTFDNW